MTTVIGGSAPSITFSDSTTQSTAALPLTGGSVSADITVHGLTVGLGGGSVSTNTAVGSGVLASGSQTGARNSAGGYIALAANTSGSDNTAYGGYSLTANTTGASNSAFGVGALQSNTTGSYNFAAGYGALLNNTTASNNTAVGYQAGYINSTGGTNCFFGNQAGYTANSSNNTFIGPYAGYYVSSGANNTVLGGYNGNQGGLDIRTSNNICVVSDGNGNPQVFTQTSNGTTTWGNFDITQGVTGGAAANAYIISGGTAGKVLNDSNGFSGLMVINDISTTGSSAVFVIGGGQCVKIAESTGTSYFVAGSSPSGSQTGYYLTGNQLYIKPATSTTYYRIWILRTRNSQ